MTDKQKLILATIIFVILMLLGSCDVKAQSVDELYLELSTTGYTKQCYDVESCNFNSLTTNQPFDLWYVRQQRLTISSNSSHFFSTDFTIKSYLPLGDEEFYFQIPIFRVIASNGDKYEVSCKSNEWELLQDFTYSPNYDYVTRKYRYSCEWQTTGSFTGVQLSMRTGSGTFTGVRIDKWSYYDVLGNSAIIDNQNKNQQQTNDRLDDVNDNLKDLDNTLNSTDGPSNLEDIADIAGYFPAGPIDSILNLPLSFAQNLLNSIQGQCSPVELPLPFIGGQLTIPCINDLYSQIRGLDILINSIGIIGGVLILYNYLCHLKDWLDSVLTLSIRTDWGGMFDSSSRGGSN